MPVIAGTIESVIKAFISSTLRTKWNRAYNLQLCDRLESRGIACFLPQRDADASSTVRVFESNIKGINDADVVLSVVLNESPNLGVEAGYTYGIKKKLLLLTETGHSMPDMFAGMDEPIQRMFVDHLDQIDTYLDELIERLR